MLADQGASSISNVLVSLTILHRFSTSVVGAFGVVFAIYLIVVNVNRSVSCEPFTMRFSGTPSRQSRQASHEVAAVGLAVGTGAGLVGVPVFLAIGGPLGSAGLAVSIAFPALVFQDAHRFMFFAKGAGP